LSESFEKTIFSINCLEIRILAVAQHGVQFLNRLAKNLGQATVIFHESDQERILGLVAVAQVKNQPLISVRAPAGHVFFPDAEGAETVRSGWRDYPAAVNVFYYAVRFFT
jgi:hypothetical protein